MVLNMQKAEFDIFKHGNVITFLMRYFHMISFFIRVMDRQKITLGFSSRRKIALE